MHTTTKLLLQGIIPVNCYMIEKDKICYLIDPGYEKERLIDYVISHELEVKGILLTHGHVDHIGAIDAFDVPVYVHEADYPVILNDTKNGFGFHHMQKGYDVASIQFVKVKDGTVLPFGDECIVVRHTPGHTVGSVCYQVGDVLYTGDTLFKGTVGKWEFPTGDFETLRKSIVALIEQTDEDVIIYPAHGKSSTIGEEKKNNPFYLEWRTQ